MFVAFVIEPRRFFNRSDLVSTESDSIEPISPRLHRHVGHHPNAVYVHVVMVQVTFFLGDNFEDVCSRK